MERAPFQAVRSYLTALEPQSGDAMLTKAFWDVLKLGPVDPGTHLLTQHLYFVSFDEQGPPLGICFRGLYVPCAISCTLYQTLA